jgi:hypothetical protein
MNAKFEQFTNRIDRCNSRGNLRIDDQEEAEEKATDSKSRDRPTYRLGKPKGLELLGLVALRGIHIQTIRIVRESRR